MPHNEIIAMILAGGRGTRLKNLTDKKAKPAVSFGGKYRIIDFPLSNCANSGVNVVGVLTQYENIFLNSYVALDQRWGLDAKDSGIYVLPPREKIKGFALYKGTADAITQNIDFIELHNPEYLLILSGDHIYKMDYSWMLFEHKKTKADVTIAVLEVPMEDAGRFGIMNIDKNNIITGFEEKPEKPKSNLASMGIYIFNWKLLKRTLLKDEKNKKSSHDFGKDIIPNLLKENKKLLAYKFKGYWMDVGTINSLWKANMDLLDKESGITLNDERWKIYTEDLALPPHFITGSANIKNSMINQGSIISGDIKNSVIFNGVIIEKGAVIKNSVVSSNVKIESGVVLDHTIVMESLTLNSGNFKGKKNEIMLISKDTKGVS